LGGAATTTALVADRSTTVAAVRLTGAGAGSAGGCGAATGASGAGGEDGASCVDCAGCAGCAGCATGGTTAGIAGCDGCEGAGGAKELGRIEVVGGAMDVVLGRATVMSGSSPRQSFHPRTMMGGRSGRDLKT